MNATERRRHLAEQGLCIDCTGPAYGNGVRCPTCARHHRELSRARYQPKHAYACTTCRKTGHNAATCMARPVIEGATPSRATS